VIVVRPMPANVQATALLGLARSLMLACRILVVPLPLRSASASRPRILYTQAEQGDYSTMRHAWLPDGSAVAVSSDDGIVRVIDLAGTIVAQVPAHGAAAPVDPVLAAALSGRWLWFAVAPPRQRSAAAGQARGRRRQLGHS